ncbi:hypothetical protein XF35_37940 [Streptomyces platensis subsp. clarensis]|nr:hypothetical protein [Streptomyces platensis subsp. clarensis]
MCHRRQRPVRRRETDHEAAQHLARRPASLAYEDLDATKVWTTTCRMAGEPTLSRGGAADADFVLTF